MHSSPSDSRCLRSAALCRPRNRPSGRSRGVGHKPRGFTLIELLVVLAILSLLVTLLMPAMHRARETAKTAVCLGNLRQIGLGLGLYAGDFGNVIPQDIMYVRRPPDFTDSDGLFWYWFLDGTDLEHNSSPPRKLPGGYVPTVEVFHCPKMNPANPGKYGMYHSQASDPVLMQESWPVNPAFRGTRLMKVERSGDFALVFDTSKSIGDDYDTGAAGWWSDRYATNPGVWMAHPDAANGVFVDGHAESCTAGRLVNTSNYNWLDGAGKKTGISWWKNYQVEIVHGTLP